MRRSALFALAFFLAVCLSFAAAVPHASAEGVFKGDTVTFGSYPQGAEGEIAPIEWTVLDVDEDGYCVLISVYGLDAKQYNEEWTEITWEDCTLRAWLNGEFCAAAFNEDEQAKMKTVGLVNGDNTEYGTLGGNDTEDRVYILSLSEVTEYYDIPRDDFWGKHDELCCKATDYTSQHSPWVYDSEGFEIYSKYDGNCWWWLRSPGYDQHYASRVSYSGYVYNSGDYVFFNRYAVRPFIRVKFE